LIPRNDQGNGDKRMRTVLVQLPFLILVSLAPPLICFAQENSESNFSLLPESWARESAITKVMPSYPEEAVRQGIAGVVHIKFETNIDGEVVRIKVKSGTDGLLVKAVAEAFRHWTFKSRRLPDGTPRPVISRFIFNFILGDDPRVELYNPGPRPPDVQHLGYYNSAKEMREWRDWEEVWKLESKP
jgi:TonB family protein